MRGGTANASVILSSSTIGSPVVDLPTVLIAMNGPSLDTFEEKVRPGGSIFINSSIVTRRPSRRDVDVYSIPVSDMAREAGLLGAANVIMATIYACVSGAIDVATVREVIPRIVKRKDLVEVNLKMADAGEEFFRNNFKNG
jgi:2-oxoglutarate ferredoxin oxidoreductase subunit gamma